MKSSIRTALALVGLVLVTTPTLACGISVERSNEYAAFAEVIVVGQIENYRILSRDGVALIEAQKMSDFASFDVRVSETLKGEVSEVIPVAWDNSTFGEPTRFKSGMYVIALMYPGSNLPPSRGTSGISFPPPDHSSFSVVQAPCSSAFILPVGTHAAEAVRDIALNQ